MTDLTQTGSQVQADLDAVEASKVGLDSSSDLSDTQSTDAKKSGFHALSAAASNAPVAERAVMITAARDADAVSELRHGHLVLTENGKLYFAEENNGTLGNWQRVVSEDATQTLTNKTLTGAALNGTLGATTPAAASVTTLDASGLSTLNGVFLDGGSFQTLAQGEAQAYGDSGSGLVLAGFGSTNDILLTNRSGQTFLKGLANTQTLETGGDLTVNGTFSSNGITDAATTEQLQVLDAITTIRNPLSVTGGSYVSITPQLLVGGTIRNVDNTSTVLISGGTATNVGANITYYAGSHATLANDIRERAGPDTIRYYDDSASLHTIYDDVSINNGYLKTYNSDANTEYAARIERGYASFAADVFQVNAHRTANSAYDFLACWSGNMADAETRLRGDGNNYADGSWNGGGADYAEYFEWSDGNPDEISRVGYSVVLDGEKIRLAQDGETPIGVISANPSVVGDADIDRWKEKYLKDEFGASQYEAYEVIEWTETIPAEIEEVQREIEVEEIHEVPVPAVKGYQFNMIDFKTDWVEVEQDDPEAEPLYKPQQKQITRQVQLSDEQIAAQEIKVPEGAERITLVEESTREEVKLELQAVQVAETIDPKTGVVTPAHEDERLVGLKKKIKLFNPDGSPAMETITLKEAGEIKHSYEADKVPEGIEVPEDAATISTEEDGETPLLRRVLNPDYDPDFVYVSREDRPEWDTVGLMGKLRLRKGQPVAPSWIKMRDISDDVEEWLVR